MTPIKTHPLTAAAFAPFGDVLDPTGEFRLINEGMCQRHHDRARLDFGPEGRAGISIFNAEARALPYEFSLVERHPEGSQAFVPMSEHPFLVIVAPDEAGTPGTPRAFVTNGAQGINFFFTLFIGGGENTFIAFDNRSNCQAHTCVTRSTLNDCSTWF
jgi:ureidoglycolate lyase